MRTGKSAGSPAAFIACMWLSLASGFAGAEPLFAVDERPMDPDQLQRLESDSFVVPDRYRLAHIDRDEIARSIDQGMPLVLNLFNDIEVRASVRSTRELASGSTFHFGELEGGGHFTMLLHHTGIVRGEVHSSRGTFVFRSEGKDRDRISIAQHDLSGVPMCGVGKEEFTPSVRGRELSNAEPKQAQPVATMPTIQAKPGASEPVDVLIVYTQRVEDHEGGPEQVRATIENEVAKMNQVLENSGLAHRQVRLVAMEKVDYTQRENIAVDLNNLEDTSADNYNNFDFSPMDEVHELREKYKADLIHLVVKEARGLCGASGVYGLYQDNWIKDRRCSGSSNPASCLVIERQKEWKKYRSSSVSAVKCFSGLTFAHELGHNFALDHDRADNDKWDEYSIERGNFTFRPYAFGYTNPNRSAQCEGQKTIMSVGAICGSIDQLARVPNFSNPDLFFPPPPSWLADFGYQPDTPMGVPGDEYTIDPDGPVNASRAIDDVWDIVASVSDPVEDLPPTVGQCIEGTPSNSLESLDDRSVEMPPEGGTRELTVSFPVAEGCTNVSLEARASGSFITTSVEKVREGEYRVVIGTSPSDGSSCETLSGRVTVSVSGVSHINSARINVTQELANRLCRSIAELPEDSVALDLSSQNESVSLRLPDGFFSRFAELESLNLSNNRLSYIERAVFEGLEKLIDLDLSRNQLTRLPPMVFGELPKLEHLNLSWNQIENFDDTIFPYDEDVIYPLRTLDLSHNRLEALPDFVFNFVHLQTLKLNDNRINGEVMEYTFFGPFQLKELNLSRNELAGLADKAFHDNKQLESLWLQSNHIASVHSNAFAGLSALRALSLSRNELAELPESVFSDLSSLENLWLYRNRLTDLPAGLFSGLSELRTLSLSGNQLNSLTDELFSDLAALEQLWLLDNDIAEISSETFEGLSSVLSLSLSDNDLTRLPSRAFSETPTLEALWLYGNGISEIAANAFDGLSNLRYLDISNNPLSTPLPASVCSFLGGVERLRAEGIEMDAVCPQ